MSNSRSYTLETHFHSDRQILEIQFSGRLDRESIAEVFEIFRQPGFTMEHQLLIDLSGASLAFSLDDLSKMVLVS